MRKLKSDGPTLQERQKQKSRESILQAARAVLAEKSYAAMAIEDVIAGANVSRATFYKYFDSKFAIGRELHREFAPSLSAVYDVLLSYDDPTEAELIDWIKQVVELYRREKGELPATAGVLVDLHLKELPEGIAAGDPIPKVVD